MDSRERRIGPGGTCVRCGHDVVSADSRPAPAAHVVCTTCVAELRPLSTWEGHRATGTWWLTEVLEHERAGFSEVLLCHGQELIRYRRDGDRLVLVDRALPEEPQ